MFFAAADLLAGDGWRKWSKDVIRRLGISADFTSNIFHCNIKLEKVLYTIYVAWEREVEVHYLGMCCGNGLVFHKQSIDMGPIFVKKPLPKVGPIS